MTPAQPGVLIPGTVRIKDAMVVWNYDPVRPEYRRITDEAVLAFAKLSDARTVPSAIRDYAMKYGVLNALQIDLPYGGKGRTADWKSLSWRKPDDARRKALNRLRAPNEPAFGLKDGTAWIVAEPASILLDRREPVELWLILARRLRAILRINTALKGRSRKYVSHAGGDPLRPTPAIGEDEDWRILWSQTPTDVATAQWIFHDEINRWLKIGGVRPHLCVRNEWSNSKTEWRLETAYNGLIGGLAYKLLLMVIGEDKLFTCDGCGQSYIRIKRAPRPGQENFCDDCTDLARKRATQRHRERKAKP